MECFHLRRNIKDFMSNPSKPPIQYDGVFLLVQTLTNRNTDALSLTPFVIPKYACVFHTTVIIVRTPSVGVPPAWVTPPQKNETLV